VKAHQNQHYAKAKKCYEALLQSQPNHPDAHYLLGMLFLEENQNQAAIASFEKTLLINPLHPEASMSLVELYLETQQPEKAQALVQSIFAAQPAYQTALQVGQWAEQFGHQEMSLHWYYAAFQQAPQEVLALKLLEAHVQHPQKVQWHQDIEAYADTLLVGSELHVKLGNSALQNGYCLKALAYYAKAEAAFPDSDILAYNQGVCYWEMNQAPKAILHFERACQINPNNQKAWLGLGQAYPQVNHYAKAVHAFEKAKAHSPLKTNLALTCRQWMTFPCIYQSKEEVQERISAYQSQTESLTELAQEIPSDWNPFGEIGLTPFYSAYFAADTYIHQKAWGDFFNQVPWIHRYDSACQALQEKRKKALTSGQKIKLAFLSRNFQPQHTIGILNQGLLQHLDRSRFEVMVFHTNDVRTQQNPLWSENPSEMTWVPYADLDQTAESILNYEADCLFYPDIGMDAFSYFSAFRRLAPLQLTTWGHPVTTGSQAIDYFIGYDAAFHPVNQHTFSESIVSLRQSLVNLSPLMSNPQMDRSYFGYSPHDNLYICSQSLFKIHPNMDPYLLGILENDPQGKLVLIAGSNPTWQETLLTRWSKQASKEIIQRIIFQPRLTPEEFIAFQGITDVLLDSFPFAGGLTSIQGLSLNVPLITMTSEQLKGSLSPALYQEMNLGHFVCRNQDEALRQALEWGQNKDLNQEVRTIIAEQKSLLFEQTEGISAFENWLEATLMKS
jgi:predicted O-linked N-acetylglucosamine transferase (SPINDLY family)